MEMASEPWYSTGPMDVFPEEFATFLLGAQRVRKAFFKHHRDLLSAKFWQDAQASIRSGYVEDFFPYPVELRFCNQFGDATATEISEKS
jgi:isocitrate dehydrogenase kinase/phosphatase